jgi:hypothetical protein
VIDTPEPTIVDRVPEVAILTLGDTVGMWLPPLPPVPTVMVYVVLAVEVKIPSWTPPPPPPPDNFTEVELDPPPPPPTTRYEMVRVE